MASKILSKVKYFIECTFFCICWKFLV